MWKGPQRPRILWLKKLGTRGAVLGPEPYCEHWSVKLEPNVTYWNSHSVIQQTFFSPIMGRAPSLGPFALDSVVYWFRINFKLMSICCDFGFSCLELWVDFVWCVQMPWKINEALAVVAVVDVTCKLYLPPFPPPIELLVFCNLKIRLW